MRIILTMLLFVLTTIGASSAEHKSVAGNYKGKVSRVVMNGKEVSKQRHDGTFTFGIANGAANGRYALTGKLEFDGGPAHHVIDLTGKKITFALDADGNIIQPQGKGHISVKVFKFFSALNKDFEVTSLKGSVKDGRLQFTIHILIPDYKNGYKASFTFSGTNP